MCSRNASECRPGVEFPSYQSCCSLDKLSRVPWTSYSFNRYYKWHSDRTLDTSQPSSALPLLKPLLLLSPSNHLLISSRHLSGLTAQSSLGPTSAIGSLTEPGVFFFSRLYLYPERLFASRFLFMSPDRDTTCLWTHLHTVSCQVTMKHCSRSFTRTSKTETAGSSEILVTIY